MMMESKMIMKFETGNLIFTVRGLKGSFQQSIL